MKIILFIFISKMLYQLYFANIPCLIIDRFSKKDTFWNDVSNEDLLKYLE